MTDTNSTIGKLLEAHQERDAIHIAVAPVIAGEKLAPGQGIALANGDLEKVVASQAAIGIVDPFLNSLVFPGQRFWMFLLPNTITSLKHNWTHPAFEAAAPQLDPKAASEAWLRNFCATSDCPGYEETIAVALGGPEYPDDDYLLFRDFDAHGSIPPEFWEHVEIVTGRKIETRPTFFSCAC